MMQSEYGEADDVQSDKVNELAHQHQLKLSVHQSRTGDDP